MATLSFAEYFPLAKRTEKTMIGDGTAIIPPWHAHHQMGFFTELGELVDALKRHYIYGEPLNTLNFVEEVGDVMWYLAGFVNNMDITWEELRKAVDSGNIFPPSLDAEAPWQKNINTMARNGARLIIQIDTLHHQGMVTAIATTIVYLDAVVKFWGGPEASLNHAMYLNIKKLAKRYGAKYSDQAALIRSLADERAVLEGKA